MFIEKFQFIMKQVSGIHTLKYLVMISQSNLTWNMIRELPHSNSDRIQETTFWISGPKRQRWRI